MLTTDGTVKILDMGLARSLSDTEDKLTEQLDDGAVVGTADFIAPEQAMNSPNVDIRADIYSLGATFFALVTGKPPFAGEHDPEAAPAPDEAAPVAGRPGHDVPAGAVGGRGADAGQEAGGPVPDPGRGDHRPGPVAAEQRDGPRRRRACPDTDMAHSETMQGDPDREWPAAGRRKAATRPASSQKKLYWVIGGVAASVVALAVAVALIASSGSRDDRGGVRGRAAARPCARRRNVRPSRRPAEPRPATTGVRTGPTAWSATGSSTPRPPAR